MKASEWAALVADLCSVATGVHAHACRGRCPDVGEDSASESLRADGCPACAVLTRADLALANKANLLAPTPRALALEAARLLRADAARSHRFSPVDGLRLALSRLERALPGRSEIRKTAARQELAVAGHHLDGVDLLAWAGGWEAWAAADLSAKVDDYLDRALPAVPHG